MSRDEATKRARKVVDQYREACGGYPFAPECLVALIADSLLAGAADMAEGERAPIPPDVARAALEACLKYMPGSEVRSWPPGFELKKTAIRLAKEALAALPAASAPPLGTDVVCGNHWHGLSGEPVDSSTGCPWCRLEETKAPAAPVDPAPPPEGGRLTYGRCRKCSEVILSPWATVGGGLACSSSCAAGLPAAAPSPGPEDATERYERLAAEFRRETGHMAPGKDRPAAMGASELTYDELRKRWDEWLKARAAASSGKREHEWRWMGITMGGNACAHCRAMSNSLAALGPCPGVAERAEPERPDGCWPCTKLGHAQITSHHMKCAECREWFCSVHAKVHDCTPRGGKGSAP